LRQDGGGHKNAGPPRPGAAAVAEAEFTGADEGSAARAAEPLLERGVRAGFAGEAVVVVSGAAEPAGLVVV
jgi:hypothetical protein